MHVVGFHAVHSQYVEIVTRVVQRCQQASNHDEGQDGHDVARDQVHGKDVEVFPTDELEGMDVDGVKVSA